MSRHRPLLHRLCPRDQERAIGNDGDGFNATKTAAKCRVGKFCLLENEAGKETRLASMPAE